MAWREIGARPLPATALQLEAPRAVGLLDFGQGGLWRIVPEHYPTVALGLGFAAQDELKNLVGGLIVLLRKPFRMGDIITSGSYYGEVIGIRPSCTILRTFEDSIVTIPNALWISKPVVSSNAGELGALVTVKFAVPADRDAREVAALAEDAARCSPYVKLDEPIYVSMKTEYERLILVVFTLKAYVFDVRFEPAMRTDILQRLFAVLRVRGILPALAEYDAD